MLSGVVFCCLLLCWTPSTLAHPDGAPVNACDTLEPEHGVQSQSGASPFTIGVSPSAIVPGQRASVTLTGRVPFKGFVVQARDSRTKQVVNGIFTVQSGAKTINCGPGGFSNTATHSSSAAKGLASMQWSAPQGFSGSVYFTGTIAETGLRYWSGLVSPVLTVQ